MKKGPFESGPAVRRYAAYAPAAHFFDDVTLWNSLLSGLLLQPSSEDVIPCFESKTCGEPIFCCICTPPILSSLTNTT